MKIKKITYKHWRDFTADLECQFCGAVERRKGYDGAHFHQNVIPSIVCRKCGKSVRENGDELTEEYRALSTRFPEGTQV